MCRLSSVPTDLSCWGGGNREKDAKGKEMFHVKHINFVYGGEKSLPFFYVVAEKERKFLPV